MTSKNGTAKKPVLTESVPGANTLAHMYGEAVWLLGQSKLHQNLKIAELEWLVMPALVLGQARIFKAGEQPIALASWAWLDDAAAERLKETGKLKPTEWRKGTDVLALLKENMGGNNAQPNPPEGNLWLVDFVCPFATEKNKLAQTCMADLMTGPLKGQKLNMIRTDVRTGEKTVTEVGGERL